MRELQSKQRLKRALYSAPSLILLSLLALVLVKGAIGVMEKDHFSAERSEALEVELLVLTAREQELEGEIESLETEEGIKEEIRERFSVTEEGEHLAIIVDDKRVASSTNQSKRSWYKRLWAAIIPFYE